jgi:excisionase family DNA binding protein
MPTNTPPVRRWASSSETAAYLGVHKCTLRQMAADGRLTAYCNGPRLIRFDLNEVDRSRGGLFLE